MASSEFSKWKSRFDLTGRIDPVELGQSREEIKNRFGEPDDVSTMVCDQGRPLIYKYESLEFHFDHGKESGLELIFEESKDGIVITSISTYNKNRYQG